MSTDPTTHPPSASTNGPIPPDHVGGVPRALGITDPHGWLLGVWQSLAVGVAFVAISLVGYHSPQPHDVPVDVVGSPADRAQVERAVRSASPGDYDLRAASAAAASADLGGGDTYATIDLSDDPTLRYAGAQGPTVFAALVRSLVPPLGAATRAAPTVVDARPLGADDAAGLPLFYLAFAVVLSSYLFTITTTNQARSLTAWGHWTSGAALAVTLGLAATLIARYGTHTVTSHTPTVAALLVLASLATATTSYFLLSLSRTFGSLLGTVVLVILGSASGGVVPGEFLPSWLAALRPVLPMGVALGAVRDVVYFGGGHVWGAVVVLALWSSLPLAAARVLARARSGQGQESTSTGMSRPALQGR